MNVPLMSNLKKLRLSGLASTLEVRLQEATGNQLNHLEFLELIVNDELGDRDSNPDTTVQSRMSCHWTIPQSSNWSIGAFADKFYVWTARNIRTANLVSSRTLCCHRRR